MTPLDALLLALAAFAAYRGFKAGAAVGVLTFVGYGIGLTLGAAVAERVLGPGAGSVRRVGLGLPIVFGVGSIVAAIGRFVGVRLWQLLRSGGLGRVDAGVGSVLGAGWALVASWLAATMLVGLPFPSVSRAIERSEVLGTLDTLLPPAPAVLSRVEHLLGADGFPQVFNDLGVTPAAPVELPTDPQARAAAAKAVGSTLKIVGTGCGGIVEGTGFVVADGVVVTNAHVVAGIRRPTVEVGGAARAATVVLWDKDLDLAVLRVAGLGVPTLTLVGTDSPTGTTGAVIGYPGGGPEKVVAAAVRRQVDAVGRDIYGRGVTERQVYELQAVVRPGNSGGPVVRSDGMVIGVVFSRSTTASDVGYALTSTSVLPRVRQAQSSSTAVGTGSCAE